eukprot:10346205-Alexandrium_andersonii.AAC.1
MQPPGRGQPWPDRASQHTGQRSAGFVAACWTAGRVDSAEIMAQLCAWDARPASTAPTCHALRGRGHQGVPPPRRRAKSQMPMA